MKEDNGDTDENKLIGKSIQQLIEDVKNRPDKSTLEIHSKYSEVFLTPEVSSPELVKHLSLNSNLHVNDCFDFDIPQNKLCDCYSTCDRCCKDLLHFTNLETVVACDVKLSTELWIRFANNSKYLKKLTFASDSTDLQFVASDDRPPKNAALDSILKIPTLKHLRFDNVSMRYFPPGPSNIESLYLKVVGLNENPDKARWDALGFSSSFDLSGHQNLKDVTIEYIGDQIKFSDLHLEKLENLESLSVHKRYLDEICDSLKQKLQIIQPSEPIVRQYEPENCWNFCKHPKFTFDFVKKYPEKNWDYKYLSKHGSDVVAMFSEKRNHPILNFDVVAMFPEKNWDWESLSNHPNLNFDVVAMFPEKQWDWKKLSARCSLDVFCKHHKLKWDLQFMTKNNWNFTLKFVEKHPEKDWDWQSIINKYGSNNEERIRELIRIHWRMQFNQKAGYEGSCKIQQQENVD